MSNSPQKKRRQNSLSEGSSLSVVNSSIEDHNFSNIGSISKESKNKIVDFESELKEENFQSNLKENKLDLNKDGVYESSKFNDMKSISKASNS